jgi:nicotinamidase-related amidase
MTKKQFTETEVLQLAKHAYSEGSADFPIVAEKCALLVIDMQDEFVKPHWTPYWVPEATRLTPEIGKCIAYCRGRRIPVIYTAFAETHRFLDRPASGEFMPNRYGVPRECGSDWFRVARIWHEIAPLEDEIVIRKPSYGAFFETPLETILKNLKRDTVIITGTLTNFCCGMTARQAYERGFFVAFVGDLTATDDPAMQEPELKVLRKGFARVLRMEELLGLLST